MITNDLTQGQPNTLQFYINQYDNTSNQIQLIMEKQNDLIKLVRELNDYQYLLVSRQSELLNSINRLNNRSSSPSPSLSETINQTQPPSHLPTANQQPLSETTNNIPRGYYPNLDTSLASRRSSQTTPQTTQPQTTQPQTHRPSRSTSQAAYDNNLIYTYFPEGRTRSTNRAPQTTSSNRSRETNLTSSLIETFLDEFLNPVNTAPTSEQIQQSTTSFVYEDIIEPVNTSCPISLNTFQSDDTILQINRCRHNYTPTSLMEWFTSNTHCPLCRIDIRDID